MVILNLDWRSTMRNYAQLIHTIFYLQPKLCQDILAAFPTFQLWHTHYHYYLSQRGVTPEQLERAALFTSHFLEHNVVLGQNPEMPFLLFSDPVYPEYLRQIPDPPFLLYYQGDLKQLSHPLLGVVGPRVPSDYGCQTTQFLIKSLGKSFGIVSGLAAGIDTTAHHSALVHSLGTIAVLGTGMDTIYPKSNTDLFHTLSEQGLILSEYPCNTPTQRLFFARRNRIITGLSKGVLIVEAGEKSGALVSARYALEQNREVFAIPGSIFSQTSIGTHRLLQDGAKLVCTAQDILDEFYDVDPPLPYEDETQLPLPLDLDPNETLIMQSLSATEEKGIDELSAITNLPIHQLLQSLTILEINGYILLTPGQRYVRK